MKASRVIISVFVLAIVGSVGVNAEDSLSIGPRFHRETSYNAAGFVGTNISHGRDLPVYKEYPGAEKVKLPSPEVSSMSVDDALAKRRSVRSFAEKPMTMAQVSAIVLAADGITRERRGVQFRTAPSGGALYPMELYMAASNVTGLTEGLYHFHPADSSLELVEAGDFSNRVHEASFEQGSVGSSPITLIISARWERSTRKYADRGYRYTYIETGAICQNVYLKAASLGLGTVAVGAFNDELTNELLGIDGESEAAILMMPVGLPKQ